MVKDPVCGMGVEDDAPDTIIKVLGGQKYYFCCVDCMLLFSNSPAEYESARPKNIAHDVVCGMDVDADNPPYTALFKDRKYYFCSASCLIHFDASPNRFVENSHA